MEYHNWCFTINNETKEDVEQCENLKYTYMILGFEVGEKCLTPHIQGYVHMKRSTSFETMQKKLPRARLQYCAGNADQNRTYCSKGYYYKGDTPVFYEYGQIPKQGQRNDLMDMLTKIREGTTREEIAQNFPRQYFYYKAKIDSMIPVTKVSKKREIYLLREKDRYAVDCFRSYYEFPNSNYEGQSQYLIDDPNVPDIRRLVDWYHNSPPIYKYGYENRVCDPDVVYLMGIGLRKAMDFFPDIVYKCLEEQVENVRLEPQNEQGADVIIEKDIKLKH